MKQYIAVILLLSVLVVSGIDGCPGGGKTAKAVSLGVEISFVQEAPPLSVSANHPFPIFVDVWNKGGQFIHSGEASFYLSGIGPNLEGVNEKVVNTRTLDKESISPDRIILAEEARFTFPLETIHTVPLSLTSCYTYGTRVQASICISPVNGTGVCEVGSEKITSTSNSAAPVQVTSLTEEVLGNKYRVLFTLENQLDGTVYLPSADCDKLQAKDVSEAFKKGKVIVEVRTKEEGFTCKLQETVAPYAPADGLVGSADLGTVVCEKILEGKKEYPTPFSIVLNYKYVDSTLKSINILP